MVPKISKLDEESIRFLVRVADDPNSWKQQTRHKRIENLQDALKESRTYPGTAQTPENTLVDINLPDLKYFAEGKVHILLRHLQAAPGWKVFIEGQRMICHRRKKQGDRWIDSGSAGFYSDRPHSKRVFSEFLHEDFKSEDPWFPIDDQDMASATDERDWQQMRYLFRFEEKPFGFHPVWSKDPHVMTLSPRAGKTNIKLHSSNQGIKSYLAIGQKGLWFEVSEQTWHERRKKTRNALKLLKELLRQVRKAEKEIDQNGYAAGLVRPGSVKRGSPSFEVKQTYANPKHVDYNVVVWVNPGAEGYVYVKAFNLGTKKYLPEGQVKWSTREFIGWSHSRDTLFSYTDHIGVWAEELALPFDARFELWFHPSGGGAERRLLAKTLRVVAPAK